MDCILNYRVNSQIAIDNNIYIFQGQVSNTNEIMNLCYSVVSHARQLMHQHHCNGFDELLSYALLL